jgi:glucosylceramidase
MKNNSLKILFVFVSISAFCQQNKKRQLASEFSTIGKNIQVYTTADSLQIRLKKTDNLVFLDAKQPLETEICVLSLKKHFKPL